MMQRINSYKESIGYPWLALRALDDVRAKRARLHGRITRGELELRLAEFRAACKALYIILLDDIKRKVGRPPRDLEGLEEWLEHVIAVMEKRGLLIRQDDIPVGGEM